MQLEEFLDKAKDLYRPYDGRGALPSRNGDIDRNYIWVSHCTGGYSGGSCWGTTAQAYHSDEPMPLFESLYELLEKVCPNITFLQGKKLEGKLVQHNTTHGYGDYYGNCSDYGVNYIHLPTMYEYLVENGIITDE